MRNGKTRALWIGILALYVLIVAAVVTLDVSLDWGVVVGLKILAVIHILLLLAILAAFGVKRKRN